MVYYCYACGVCRELYDQAARVSGGRLPWSSLVPAVLLPNLFYASGRGAIVPVIPLLAVQLGLSYAAAALIAALLTLGEFSTTLAATWLVVRIGERGAMLVGAGLTGAGSLMAMVATNASMLALGVFLVGSASSVYVMARQAWVALAVPRHQRGRAYSLVGGSQRFGLLVGPFASAAVISVAGHERWAFAVTVVASAAIAVILLLWPISSSGAGSGKGLGTETGEAMPGVLRTLFERRGALVRLGGANAILAAMRAVRLILIPLWGAGLGLEAVEVTLVVGATGLIDVGLFYVGGRLTDRFGTRMVGAGTLVGFTIAHLGLALSNLLPAQIQIYVGLAVLMSIANGLSSGIIATMGAELADPQRPAVFLGPWRLVCQTGSACVPLILAAAIAVVSLPLAAATMGVLALSGTAAMWIYVPRYLPGDPDR